MGEISPHFLCENIVFKNISTFITQQEKNEKFQYDNVVISFNKFADW